MHTLLLHTKLLIPGLTQTITSRTRLLHRLSKRAESRLTLLSAPAGYGKTTALAQWAATLPADGWYVAWLSLDKRDNDPALFWHYVLTAFDTCIPGISKTAFTLLTEQLDFTWEPMLMTLINSISHQEKCILLILDDYHALHEPSLHAACTFLLEHLPSQLRLVLSTRVDPPLPLAQLRARGQLHEVRVEQLRCTVEEVAHFLTEVMQLPLSQDEILHFADRTEGWFAGLKLAALSLQQQEELARPMSSLQGNQRHILDYLMNDVFFSLAPQLQHFLLTTSILDEMCDSLCDAVIESTGSQDVLEEIERTNIFLCAQDERRAWYRYHQLFAEALRYRLQRNHSEAYIHELHMRASVWYQKHDDRERAIHHALEAQAWDVVAKLIESSSAPEDRTNYHLMQWLQRLPMEHLLRTLQWHLQMQGRDPVPFLDHFFSPSFLAQQGSAPDTIEGKLSAYQGLVEPLSKREAEVLALLISGLTNKDIAERLMITVSTVKQHVSSILGKLGVINRNQAQARIRMLGLI